MNATEYLRAQPVFSLEEAAKALGGDAEPAVARERLKYHLERGRLQSVARGVYATVPPGLSAAGFQPDPFLVAAVTRPDAVLSHHSALELLGAAHSAWNLVTAFTQSRRAPLQLEGARIRFLDHPAALRRSAQEALGVRSIRRANRSLRVTGPERTLVDGLRQPDLAGGLEELVESAAGFAVLDLELLRKILVAYQSKSLWAAVGWFLERYQRTFYVPDGYLEELVRYRPKSPHYMARGQRGGELNRRWNLILPVSLGSGREPDEA